MATRFDNRPTTFGRAACMFSVMLWLGGCEAPPSKKPVAEANQAGEVEKPDGAAAKSAEAPAERTATETAKGVEVAPAEPGAVEQKMAAKTEVAIAPKPGEGPTPEPAAAKVLLGTPELLGGIPGKGPLKVEEIKAWLDDPNNTQPFAIELPLGLSLGISQMKGLEQNPLTRAKIELGRQLYFDPRLSADGSVSCASCHHPDTGWAAHTQFGVGIGGQTGGRNSPVSFNRILSDFQFWDGRAPSLEAQAVGPIANPIEMGNTHEAVVATLKKVPGYELEFNKIFGELTIEAVGKAIASFERAVVTGPAPYDYYERFLPLSKQDPEELKTDDPDLYAKYLAYKKDVDDHPMSASAIRGRALFFGEKANCTACHVGPNFSDEAYHNLGIGMDKPEPDLGREAITKNEADRGAFKTPTIRNVALSGPFMHDGSLATLEDVVEWYDKGGLSNPHLDLKIKKLNLTAEEKADLVEFMKACEGPFPTMARDRLPE